MSLAYLDPGNLEADLQQGAYTGYKILWVLFWCTALGLFLQILAARLGVTTGKDLASMCVDKKHGYSKPVAMALWVCTELAIVGSDIQEVVGSAIAFRILFGFPLYVGCLITALDTFTFLGLHAFGYVNSRPLLPYLSVRSACFWITDGKTGCGKYFGGIAIPKLTVHGKSSRGNDAASCCTPVSSPLSCSLVMWIEIVPRGSNCKQVQCDRVHWNLLFSFIVIWLLWARMLPRSSIMNVPLPTVVRTHS